MFLISTVVPFVPSEFIPDTVLRQFAGIKIRIRCPFHNVGNPLPNCTWSRTDSNNITHEIQFYEPKVLEEDSSFCDINYIFTENDNGLYQCTGHNVIGNITYTFPERFIVESEITSYILYRYIVAYISDL